MSDATIRIIGRGERCCLSIESDAPLPGDDHAAAAERVVHGVADIFVAPIARIAERIGVEPICGELPDGVYITTPDGRVYDWPAVVDALVSRIELQPVDLDVLARRMLSIAMVVPLNDVAVLKPDHHEYITSAVSSLCEVLPGVARDDVYEQVKGVIAELHTAQHKRTLAEDEQRPDYVMCIQVEGDKRKSLCGRDGPFDWRFVNYQHSINTVEAGSAMMCCPECKQIAQGG